MSFLPKIPTPGIPSVPAVGPLSNALLGSNKSDATNASKAKEPFQIPLANPVTGALDVISSSALSTLDEAARSVLASAPEIPIVHADGTVTVVPGGEEGVKNLKEKPEEVIGSAPAATKLDDGNTAGQAVGKLSTNPFSSAASLAQSTVTSGISGLTSLSRSAIANAPSVPVVLPTGQLSIIQGGKDGLMKLEKDAGNVLKGAPVLPGLADLAAGGAGAIGGLAGGLNPLGGGMSILTDVRTAVDTLSHLTHSLVTSLTTTTELLTSNDVGPAEIDSFAAKNANTIVKLTFFGIVGVFGLVAAGGVMVVLGVVLAAAAVPVVGGLVVLLGLEALVWRHWRNVRKTEGTDGASTGANGSVIATDGAANPRSYGGGGDFGFGGLPNPLSILSGNSTNGNAVH